MSESAGCGAIAACHGEAAAADYEQSETVQLRESLQALENEVFAGSSTADILMADAVAK